MEGDSTDSFVDISGCEETAEEKEQPEDSDPKPDTSQDIQCDETEVTPEDEGPTSREEMSSLEPTEPGKSSDHREENTEDGQDSAENYETAPSEEDAEQDTEISSEDHQEAQPEDHQEAQPEDHQEAQPVRDGYRRPQETTGSQDEDETLVSDKPEPQGDKTRSMEPKEGNCRDGKESEAVSTQETMEGSQDAEEAKNEQPEAQADEVMYTESQGREDVAQDDGLSEQKTTEGDQEQPERTREKMSESTSEELTLHTCPLPGNDRSLWTSRIDGAVTLRVEESGPAAVCPITVSQFFSEAVRKHRHKVALCTRAATKWEGITYTQYEQQSRAVARGLLKLGLQQFHAVLILGFNSPEWFMSEIAAMLAGGSAVAVDPLSTASFLLKVAEDSRPQIILVDEHSRLEKILQIRAQLPDLRAIIQWRGRMRDPGPGTYTWQQLVNLGLELEESYLDVVIAKQEPQQCCAVMYPPDGAGEPRGAMISHDNVTWTCWALQETLGLGSEEVVLSYLPLGHMAVQLFDLWLPLSCGGTTYFTAPDPQKGPLVSTLCDVRPTLFLGFPGLWEKVKKRWMLVEKKATPLQKMTISWARKISHHSYTSSGSRPWGHHLADHLVFRPARMALGLDRCTLCYVGTEPISKEVEEYFRSLGIDLLELCGKNETSGVESIMVPSSRRTGRVQLAGCRRRGSQDGPGRCLWGRNTFLGYLGMEQATSEAFTEDGWFITGTRPLLRRPADPGDLYLEL